MGKLGVRPLSSLHGTRVLGPTKSGRRGATPCAYPDANEGWAPQPYRYCPPLSLIHISHLTSSTLSAILAINADKVSLVAVNSCIFFVDLRLQDFHRLHPDTDHFQLVIAMNHLAYSDVGRQSFQYRLGRIHTIFPQPLKNESFQGVHLQNDRHLLQSDRVTHGTLSTPGRSNKPCKIPILDQVYTLQNPKNQFVHPKYPSTLIPQTPNPSPKNPMIPKQKSAYDLSSHLPT